MMRPPPISVQHVGIDAEDLEEALHIGEVMKRAGFKGEVVNRSLEQNDCLHKWCRIIRDHLQENGVRLHEGAVKELILRGLGNTKKVAVKGIKADKKRIKHLLNNSLMLVTALAPKIGYDKAAKIAKLAYKNGTTLKHEVIKAGLIHEREYDKIMSPLKMTKPK